MTSSIDTAREVHATWLMIPTGRQAGRPPPARFAALFLPLVLLLGPAQAAAAENQRMLSEFTAGNAAALAALRSEHGVHPRPMPDAVIRELRRLSAEVVAETAELGPLNRRIYESWARFRDQVTALAPFAEQGALNQRML